MIDSIKNKLREWELYDFSRELYRLLVKKIGARILSLFMVKERLGKASSKLVVGIMDPSGFGDTLVELPLIEKIRETVGQEKCFIVFCNKYSSFYNDFNQIDLAVQYKNDIVSFAKLNAGCDLVLSIGTANHVLNVRKINRKKVRNYSPKLLCYCDETMNFLRKNFGSCMHNYRIDQYGILMGKHRIEFLDMKGVLGIKRKDAVCMPSFGEYSTVLDKFGLRGRKYIAVNRDTGSGDENQPKLWSLDRYITLLKQIKRTYPDILLVLIGGRTNKALLKYVDVDTAGQTNLQELAVLLKNSLFLIACEGGPVHLQHFIGGKSIVIFGPTSPKMFGYGGNENISLTKCTHHCLWMVDNWSDKCIRGESNPKCMEEVTPEIVMTHVAKIMSGQRIG